MYEQIFAPLDLYIDELKEKHAKNVSEFFDKLVLQSGINETENAKTVALYEKELAEKKKREESVRTLKTKRGFAIFLIISAFIVGLIVGYKLFRQDAGRAICILVLGGLAVFAICKVCKKINATIRGLNGEISAIQQTANAFLSEAQSQTASLNNLFTSYDALALIQKTLPCVQFDCYFTGARLTQLANEFDYPIRYSREESIVDVLSGELYGNPFLFESYQNHNLGWHTYTGSLTIHWTTREKDYNGQTVTRSHTQTLHANITKPKPYYDVQTRLQYGNENAPELCFSRENKHVEDKNETQLKRALKQGERKLQRLTAKALKQDKNFTEMLNTEFEVFFGAVNRNDELAFRYLFTPNAQEEMLKLLLYSEGYGDDFDFIKYKKRNTICSEHTQINGISTSANRYYSHSFAEIKANFNAFNNEFFKSIYFDFAPILTISAYQQPRLKPLDIRRGDLCCYHYEILANQLKECILPSDTIHGVIFKTELLQKQGAEERVAVTAYTYTAHERVHYESVYGNDGKWHSVPVHWTEYIPFEVRKTMLIVCAEEGQKPDMPNPFVFYQGAFACIL